MEGNWFTPCFVLTDKRTMFEAYIGQEEIDRVRSIGLDNIDAINLTQTEEHTIPKKIITGELKIQDVFIEIVLPKGEEVCLN